MSIDKILHEASTILQAAQRYSSELSEIGIIDHELHRMRVLITQVAAHNYTSIAKKTNISAQVRELKNVQEVLLKTARQRFGNTSKVLGEFRSKMNGS